MTNRRPEVNLPANDQRHQSPGADFPENADGFEIPALLQMAKNGTRLATENMIASIDHKLEKLAALGLRPHQNILGYRQELMEQLESNGPYRLRVSSGIF